MKSRPSHLTAFSLGLLCIKLMLGCADAAEPNPTVRMLPYPFSNVVSFASDADAQRPWHGAAIHRIFNEELGLTISDSLFPQGGYNASSFFFGPGQLNRRNSGVGTQPTFALLLRQWHRGNIDHFHGWQEDGIIGLRNEIDPPLALSGVRISQGIPAASNLLQSQQPRNVRFHFSAEPPVDLTIILHDRQGKSVSFNPGSIARGKNIQFEVGKPNWIVEVIIPFGFSNSTTLAANSMMIDRIDLVAPSCATGCAAKLTRVERDHFSRQTVLSQISWLERWNVRPAVLTSHGGNTLIQDFGIEGASLKVPRSEYKDGAVVEKLEALADQKQSHAYHSDLLRQLGLLAVWSYFPEKPEHTFAKLVDDELARSMPPLTTTYEGLYNLPRISLPGFDLTDEKKFAEAMGKQYPDFSEDERRSFYCGTGCNHAQGNALAVLLGISVYLVNHGKKLKHLWYTHFGSENGTAEFNASPEVPITPVVRKWMRLFANHVYNFDGTIDPDRRVWSPPANTWFRYQVMQAGIASQVSLEPDTSTVNITPWQDPVTKTTWPDPLAGTRDLHGLTLYVADPDHASVKVGTKSIETFTLNPPDEAGKASITVVDDNTPTSIVGNVALKDRGDVEAISGRFTDTSDSKDYVTLETDKSGNASIVFKPWSLDLWNISHLHFAVRKRSSAVAGSSNAEATYQIQLLMQDGGLVSILGSNRQVSASNESSTWQLPKLTAFDEWKFQTLDVTRLTWPKSVGNDQIWRRPPLPVGKVREVRISVAGAAEGEIFDIRNFRALRPSGNGEAPNGTKLVAGRVTLDGMIPVPLVHVQALSSSGKVLTAATDSDGYYFFYDRPRGDSLSIRATLGRSNCYPLQGRRIEVLKNEAEIDIEMNNCVH